MVNGTQPVTVHIVEKLWGTDPQASLLFTHPKPTLPYTVRQPKVALPPLTLSCYTSALESGRRASTMCL